MSLKPPQLSLVASLEGVQARVRAAPADVDARQELCYVLALTGQWERARLQFEAIRSLDDRMSGWSRVYGSCVDSELERAEVFSGARAPVVFGEPPPWCAWLTEALRLEGRGEREQGATLRETALEQCGAVAGRCHLRAQGGADAEPRDDVLAFDWLEDGDSRMGPVLELVLEGRYMWAPLSRVRRMVAMTERSRWDRLWAPFRFTWENGGESPAFVPVRYVGSERNADDELRMARCTEWTETNAGSGRYIGLGHKTLVAGTGTDGHTDVPLLKISLVEIGPAVD